MTQELFRVRCKQGQLIITDEYIRTELPFSAQQHTLYRAALTGVDSQMAVPSVLGAGGSTNLVFHGQGEALRADLVNPKMAKEIVAALQRPSQVYSQPSQQPQWQSPSQSQQGQWQVAPSQQVPYQPAPPQYPPQGYPMPMQSQPLPGQFQQPLPPPKKRSKRFWLIVGGVVLFVVIVGAIMNATGAGNTDTAQSSTPQATTTPTQASHPTIVPTPQPIHYPPKTGADLRGLAAEGDANAIHEFHSESVGLTGVCPQPKREVTTDPSVTGQQLAEDLLAYFYAQQLDSPCGSVVFAYHNQAEATGNGYTAGRILFDAIDSRGASNVDPNASNLKYTLTLDIGGALTNQEYVVTY